MDTNTLSIIKSAGDYAQDLFTVLWDMKAFPSSILGGLVVGLIAKLAVNFVPIGKSHKAVIPFLSILAGTILFHQFSPPDSAGTAPFKMRNPELREYLIGAVAGLCSVIVHRKFLKDTAVERWLTRENGVDNEKPSDSTDDK